MIGSTRASAFAFFTCILLSGPASAQQGDAGSSKAVEAARALYVEGKDLRREGDLERSLEKLEAARALHATPITGLEVARAHGLLGQLREAIEVLDSIGRLPVKLAESEKAVSARGEARALATQYRARVPKLSLSVEGSGVRVWLDGEALPTEALETPRLVNPGAHHVEAALGARRASQDVRIVEGEERMVTLRFIDPEGAASSRSAGAPAGSAAVAPAAPVSPSADPRPPRSPNILAYAGFGVGAVSAVTGAIAGALTLSRASDLKQACKVGICPSSAGLNSTTMLGTVSTIAFVGAGAGIAVGVGALLFAGGERPEARKGAWIRPWLGVASAGITGGF